MPADNPHQILEDALGDTTGVYVVAGEDVEAYYAHLRASIKASFINPLCVLATIMEPGFPNRATGSVISGICLAHNAGYWLVYEPEERQFYCFWGSSPESLGAHGVYGSPLYCWSA